MPNNYLDVLQQLKVKVASAEAQEAYDHEKYDEALAALGNPTTSDDRELAAKCHYRRLCQLCAGGAVGAASDAGAALSRIKTSSQTLKTLANDRLRILNMPTPSYIGAPRVQFSPSIAHVDGLGEVTVLGTYGVYGRKGTLNDVVHLLKKAPEELDPYLEDPRPPTFNFAGKSIATVLKRQNVTHKIDLIIPIPTDPERASVRGYSVPEAIARALSAFATIPVYTNILRKTRSTRSLRDLGAGERAREIAGSMDVAENKRYLLDGATVMLIDDVVTYGTTFREAKRVLLAAGAGTIVACALASASPDRHMLEAITL